MLAQAAVALLLAVAGSASADDCTCKQKHAAASSSQCPWYFATADCSKNPLGCYFSNSSAGYPITSNGVERTFTLHVPEGFNASAQTPIIFDFHGRNSNSNYEYNLTSLYNSTWNPSWLSVYPQGLLGRGNESAWEGASYAAPHVNDTLFVSDLLASLKSCFSIDTARVFAIGKSNGGGFVDTLACSTAGASFAAFSACSGAFYTDNALGDCPYDSRPRRPFLEFHGGADTTIPYAGETDGNGGDTPPIPDWLGWWAQRNGCPAGQGKQVVTPPGQKLGQVNLTEYTCSSQSDVVQGYWINGMGHVWPSTTYNLDNDGTDLAPLNATPLIIDFFKRWAL